MSNETKTVLTSSETTVTDEQVVDFLQKMDKSGSASWFGQSTGKSKSLAGTAFGMDSSTASAIRGRVEELMLMQALPEDASEATKNAYELLGQKCAANLTQDYTWLSEHKLASKDALQAMTKDQLIDEYIWGSLAYDGALAQSCGYNHQSGSVPKDVSDRVTAMQTYEADTVQLLMEKHGMSMDAISAQASTRYQAMTARPCSNAPASVAGVVWRHSNEKSHTAPTQQAGKDATAQTGTSAPSAGKTFGGKSNWTKSDSWDLVKNLVVDLGGFAIAKGITDHFSGNKWAGWVVGLGAAAGLHYIGAGKTLVDVVKKSDLLGKAKDKLTAGKTSDEQPTNTNSDDKTRRLPSAVKAGSRDKSYDMEM